MPPKFIPPWGLIKQYPFDTVKEGTVWEVDRRDQADSIRCCFHNWAEARGVKMRAMTWTEYLPEGGSIVNIKFSASITKKPRRKL